MVFTASHASYAKAVIDYLDPDRKYISEWFSREDCCKKEGFYLKDLRVIDRKLSNMLLIDNVIIFLLRQHIVIACSWRMECPLFLSIVIKQTLN